MSWGTSKQAGLQVPMYQDRVILIPHAFVPFPQLTSQVQNQRCTYIYDRAAMDMKLGIIMLFVGYVSFLSPASTVIIDDPALIRLIINPGP